MKHMRRRQFSLRQMLAVLVLASLAMLFWRWRVERINAAFRQAIIQSDVFRHEETPLLQALFSQRKAHRGGLIRRLGLENITSGKLGWNAANRSNLVWRSQTMTVGRPELQMYLFAGIPNFKSNQQRQTLVVTDSQNRLLYWEALPADSYFDRATIEQRAPRIRLAVQGWQQSGGGRRGVRRYIVSPEQTESLPGIEWRETEFNNRAWRRWLKQRWKISMQLDRTDEQERIGQE